MPTSEREILIKQLSNSKAIRERVDLLEQIARAEPGTPITFTTASFVQPALGGSVVVEMDNVIWLVPDSNQMIRVGKDWGAGFVGGNYIVVGVDEENSRATLMLEDSGSPSIAGTTVLSQSPVVITGRDGLDGKSFATLTAQFTTPAINSQATASVNSTNLFVVGDRVKLGGFSHEVMSINTGNSTVALKNLNATPALVYAVGSKIIVAIAQDATEITATTIPGIDPTPTGGTVQQKLDAAGQRLLEAEARIKRRVYTVTSVVPVIDGGTADNLAAVTPQALGFATEAALETYLATGKIPIYVSGYKGPGDAAWGQGLVKKDAGLSALSGIIVAMPAIGANWYWVRDFVGPLHMSWAGVRPSVGNVVDQRATMQAVIDYAATLPERTVVLDVDGSNEPITNRYYINSVHPVHTSYGLVIPSGVKLTSNASTTVLRTSIWGGPGLAGKRAVLTTTPNANTSGVFLDGICVHANYTVDYAIQIGGATTNIYNSGSGYKNCIGAFGVKGCWSINSYLSSFENCQAGYYGRYNRNGGAPVKSSWTPSNPVPSYDVSFENFLGFDIIGVTSLVFKNCYANSATVNWRVSGLNYSSFVGCASDSGEVAYAFLSCNNIVAQIGSEYAKMPLYVSASSGMDINLQGDPCGLIGTDPSTNYYSDTQTDYLFEVAGGSRVSFSGLNLHCKKPSMGGIIYTPARNFGKISTASFVSFQFVGMTNYTDRVISGVWDNGNTSKMLLAVLDVGYTGGLVSGGFSIEGVPGWMTILGKEYYTHALVKPIIRADHNHLAEAGNVLTKALAIKYTSSIVFPDGNPGSDFSEFKAYYSGLPNKWAAGVASDNAGTVRITSPGHTLSNGNPICISEKYPYYQGLHPVSNVTTDTFDIPATFRAYEATNIEWCTRKLTGSISTMRQGDYAGNSVFEYVVTNSFVSPASSNIDINPTVIWNPMVARGKVVQGFVYRIMDLGATSAFDGSNLFPVGTGLTFGNGSVVRVNQAGHELVSGNAIVISGTTSYNGTKYAQRIDDDNFNVYDNSTLTTPTTWVADEAGDYHTNVLNNALIAKSTGYPTSWDTDAILRAEFTLADAAASSVFKVRTVVQVEEVADKAVANPVWLERPVRFDAQV